VLEWILLKKNKLNFFNCIIVIGVSYLFYLFFQARTDFILTVLFVVLVLLSQGTFNKFISKIFKSKALVISPWILTIICFFVLFFVKTGTGIYNVLNRLLSSRMDIFKFYYHSTGINFLPQKITFLFQNSTFAGMDNAYIYMGIYEGIFLLVIFCLLEQRIALKIKTMPITNALVYIILLLLGLTESLMIYPFINILVVYFCHPKENTVLESEEKNNEKQD